MPRIARAVVAGVPYHVTQRGNNRQEVFFVDDDRAAYLSFLAAEALKHGLSILGYCLMTNHVHLVVVPRTAEALAKALGRAHFSFAQYINRLHGRSGHLWQGRFYSAPLDDQYLWTSLCYVERNPVRAKIVRRAWNYPWSSAAVHVGERATDPLIDLAEWRSLSRGMRWRRTLTDPQDEQTVAALRRGVLRGRPLGNDSFVSKLERALGRRLRAMPVGRPPKKKNASARRATKHATPKNQRNKRTRARAKNGK